MPALAGILEFDKESLESPKGGISGEEKA